MCVVNGRTDKGHCREANLPFEGFLEALCRMAVMKALPTDEEIESRGHEHAGEHMAWFKNRDEVGFKQMLSKRNTPWGQEYTLQPVSRCVEHVITMIIWTIEEDISEADTPSRNGKLTEPEMLRWVRCKNLRTVIR
jgi:hypothetical protein